MASVTKEEERSYEEEYEMTRSELLTSMKSIDVEDEEISGMIEQFVGSLEDADEDLSFEMLRFMANFMLQVLGDTSRCRTILQAGVRLYPDNLDSLVALGNFESDVCKRYDEAEDLYRTCLDLKEDHTDACNNLGALLIERAKQTEDKEERSKYFQEARSVLSKALDCSPPVVIYNIACVCALEGSLEKCKFWLEKGMKEGVLPSPEVLKSDPDILSVRENSSTATTTCDSWFESFIKTYEESSSASSE